MNFPFSQKFPRLLLTVNFGESKLNKSERDLRTKNSFLNMELAFCMRKSCSRRDARSFIVFFFKNVIVMPENGFNFNFIWRHESNTEASGIYRNKFSLEMLKCLPHCCLSLSFIFIMTVKQICAEKVIFLL